MKKFLVSLSSFSGLFLLVASLCNFFLAYKAVSVSNSYVVTNVVEMVTVSTNDVSSASEPPTNKLQLFKSPSISPANSPPPAEYVPKQVANYPYQYFLVGRRIGAYMFGRYYYDGSPCSFGRIREIYPDRIILANGDWIQNKFDQSPPSREIDRKVTKNDR